MWALCHIYRSIIVMKTERGELIQTKAGVSVLRRLENYTIVIIHHTNKDLAVL